ncbi:MAG TPA: hypothetical protein VIM02_00055 [Rhizomicrobium sp.]|jgi:hypothetical protein
MTEMANISFSLREQISLKSFVAVGRPYAERISLALAIRLLSTNPREIPYLLHEIDVLEGFPGISRTKRAEKFRHAPLSPFYHKHFSSPRHVPWNIGTALGLRKDGNQRLDDIIRQVARDVGECSDIWPTVLADRIGFEGYAHQAGKGLSGDWLIYAKHENKNYYLDVATHWEGEAPRAQQLLQKLRLGCEAEFPFCFQ